jgi:hypothetical protein
VWSSPGVRCCSWLQINFVNSTYMCITSRFQSQTTLSGSDCCIVRSHRLSAEPWHQGCLHLEGQPAKWCLSSRSASFPHHQISVQLQRTCTVASRLSCMCHMRRALFEWHHDVAFTRPAVWWGTCQVKPPHLRDCVAFPLRYGIFLDETTWPSPPSLCACSMPSSPA